MLLSVENLTKTYPAETGALTVLDGVHLTLSAGQSLALTGESGSGKSTLLHLIGGLDQPDHGRVILEGCDIVGLPDTELAQLRRSTLGLIFQQFNLIPSLTVAQNLTFHARLAERTDPHWQAEVIGRLGLETLLARYPEQLSGGQQQRVAIGRTLILRPALILADEPTGNLDEASADGVMALLVELTQAAGAGLLMVTHSPTRADMLDARIHLASGRIT